MHWLAVPRSVALLVASVEDQAPGPTLMYSKLSYLTADPARVAGQIRREDIAFITPREAFATAESWRKKRNAAEDGP